MSEIPYMGSKRRLAKKIIDTIILNNPKAKYFYDLFGGGGAISLEALKRPQFKKVVYNDIDTGGCELLRKIQKDGVTEDFFEWVDRETFHKFKYGSDWKAGLIKTCWSFGTGLNGYLYGKDRENLKKEAHYYLIKNGYIESRNTETRIRLLKEFREKEKIVKRFDLEHLERLESLDRIQNIGRLEIHNISFEKLVIETPIEETIIYCDPPYFGTAKYQHDIKHEEFYNWVKNNPYKIYISSYEAPFFEVAQFEHRSTLSYNKKVIEKLFCNMGANGGD